MAITVLGNSVSISGELVRPCCYGENRWQSPAALFATGTEDPLALSKFEIVGEDTTLDPSYVNWTDLDRLLQTITHIAAAFDVNREEVPCIAVGCKHGNAAGAAFGDDPCTVLEKTIQGNPLSIFGGLVIMNFPLTKEGALALHGSQKKILLDGVIAPAFESGSMEALRRKNGKCRFYQNPALTQLSQHSLDMQPRFRYVRGGILTQPNYTYILNLQDPQLERNGPKPWSYTEEDLLLAWGVGSTSNSNTITIVKDSMVIGNGVGQQDRVGCSCLALDRAHGSNHDTHMASAYSDSFFPFPDGVERLIGFGVGTILTTSGSQNDQKIKESCSKGKKGVTLLMIPDAIARGFFGH